MEWDVETTDQFNAWYDGLGEANDDAVSAAIEYLIQGAPGLGRPFVDTTEQSRISNLKE